MLSNARRAFDADMDVEQFKMIIINFIGFFFPKWVYGCWATPLPKDVKQCKMDPLYSNQLFHSSLLMPPALSGNYGNHIFNKGLLFICVKHGILYRSYYTISISYWYIISKHNDIIILNCISILSNILSIWDPVSRREF